LQRQGQEGVVLLQGRLVSDAQQEEGRKIQRQLTSEPIGKDGGRGAFPGRALDFDVVK
jgi:hypothetical protein